MTAIYRTPETDHEDAGVINEIRGLRDSLATMLRTPRRWTSGMRRTTQARAIQGSNTIEGYTVSDQDALAAVDDEPPLTADQRTWSEILGYRRMMTYILRMAPEVGFGIDSQTLRSMHFMLLEHDLSVEPGRFRPGPIYVRDETRDATVYEGPPSEMVPGLVEALVDTLTTGGTEPLVDAAMAHLNLVMIHPFKDGNGRIARALQTFVLAQDRVLELTFSSIEEWLGGNTEDYHRILAATGRGAWNPQHDAGLWIKFNLRAHHMQAQTLQRRFDEAVRTWQAIDELIARHGVQERTADALFDAVRGLRVARPTYVKQAGIEEQTASRDLRALVAAGLLEAHGQTRGRYYTATGPLRAIGHDIRSGRPALADPYPWLIDDVRRRAAA
ncbi:Fic family protein [Isoptericola dokdonensis]|uniref:Adenosine monophosphate-protein transferase SoFic n=1 Tax=Isoptericola dokdonensis DS-3 TaxID=1300344 RepID=A0A161HZS0_9MICO|nr:Fic family protein [Isoptericola dokdonensis]ANC32163.1 Adenosine monophosphate-protein transferase SoFic [Isoptericola dokdonensis DS-3]